MTDIINQLMGLLSIIVKMQTYTLFANIRWIILGYIYIYVPDQNKLPTFTGNIDVESYRNERCKAKNRNELAMKSESEWERMRTSEWIDELVQLNYGREHRWIDKDSNKNASLSIR